MMALLRQACHEPYSVWLDSALVDDCLGQTSFWATDPFLVLRSRGTQVELIGRSRNHRMTANPFDVLRSLLQEHAGRGINGGAAGYFAYELKRFAERVPALARDDLALPECYLAFYDRIARFDPCATACGNTPVRCSPLARSGPLPASTFGREDYLRAVARAKDHIVSGDVYQVNLSHRFRVPLVGDPFDAYLRLRARNPAPFAACLNFPELQVLSASPERFLRVDPATRRIQTRPIKGTRPRGRTPSEDHRLARELLASEKDRAENVMIVDLERNDLGRVADIGSVRVTELAALETFPSVFHLTSTIEARLREDRDIVDLLRATFPGGSVTGVPKVRAMEIIDALEPTARSVYTGAIGYIGFDGSLDLNIAIRTAAVKHGVAYIQAGGGIVADSEPSTEYEETLHKAAALIDALTGASDSGQEACSWATGSS